MTLKTLPSAACRKRTVGATFEKTSRQAVIARRVRKTTDFSLEEKY